jgi:uncharacterized protein (DUF1330 family)
MAAYVIVDVEVKDPVRYEEYRKLAGKAVEAFGGRFLVRGGRVRTLEGTWDPGRVVVLEFPTAERAREWWNSPEYRPARALRQETASTQMILVEGV